MMPRGCHPDDADATTGFGPLRLLSRPAGFEVRDASTLLRQYQYLWLTNVNTSMADCALAPNDGNPGPSD